MAYGGGLRIFIEKYRRQKTVSHVRKIACLLLCLAAAPGIFVCGAALVGTNGVSMLIALPLSFLILCFGLGVRIGRGFVYVFKGLGIIAVVLLISLLYNFYHKA